MSPILFVMNPRRIPKALISIDALNIDKAWLVAYWEKQLEQVTDDLIATDREHSHVLLIADDVIPTQKALDLVLALLSDGHPVVTGYCNLDKTAPHVNITRSPFKVLDRSVGSDYDWYTKDEAASYPAPIIPSHFAGSCLTGMSIEMWRRFPFRCVTRPEEPRGYSSDWHLSRRLANENVPIVAPRGALCEHLKDDWRSQAISSPEKRLLIGEIEAKVRLERRVGSIQRVVNA